MRNTLQVLSEKYSSLNERSGERSGRHTTKKSKESNHGIDLNIESTNKNRPDITRIDNYYDETFKGERVIAELAADAKKISDNGVVTCYVLVSQPGTYHIFVKNGTNVIYNNKGPSQHHCAPEKRYEYISYTDENGLRHREDGPARIWIHPPPLSTPNPEFWIHGSKVSVQEHAEWLLANKSKEHGIDLNIERTTIVETSDFNGPVYIPNEPLHHSKQILSNETGITCIKNIPIGIDDGTYSLTYIKTGTNIVYNRDKPSIVKYSNDLIVYLCYTDENGKYHNKNGAAREWFTHGKRTTYDEYWINGTNVTADEYAAWKTIEDAEQDSGHGISLNIEHTQRQSSKQWTKTGKENSESEEYLNNTSKSYYWFKKGTVNFTKHGDINLDIDTKLRPIMHNIDGPAWFKPSDGGASYWVNDKRFENETDYLLWKIQHDSGHGINLDLESTNTDQVWTIVSEPVAKSIGKYHVFFKNNPTNIFIWHQLFYDHNVANPNLDRLKSLIQAFNIWNIPLDTGKKMLNGNIWGDSPEALENVAHLYLKYNSEQTGIDLDI